MVPTSSSEKAFTRSLLDVLIRAGLIAVLVLFCFEIFSPFRDLMLWSLILAITLYPLQERLKGSLGQKGRPHCDADRADRYRCPHGADLLLVTSIADSVAHAMATVKDGNFHIPPPADSVADWPLVGKPVSAYGCRLQPIFPTWQRSTCRRSNMSA